MKTSDFYYDLPEQLIAQTPIEPRDSSRMMVLHRDSEQIDHKIFRDIADVLQPGDCLILNNTKVLPARLYGISETGARVEFLLLNQLDERDSPIWECLAGPGKRAKEGSKFSFGEGILHGEVIEVREDGNRVVRFTYDAPSFYAVLDQIGEMPLPHYITEELEDPDRYNTVYAEHAGSAAAPTAGLHFTPELLQRIEDSGVKLGYVTLHVGLGTFRPVKSENIADHVMHAEHYAMPADTAEMIRETKARGGRVIAVGTTCVRTLESVMAQHGSMKACEGWTDIFIYPGFEFRGLDGLLTNFHLPESTLIMLVSAIYGHEKTMHAYRTAVAEEYRFYSFGDCMLII
ncbi:MAG: tRNA preQ1(34) S-adenosylmethionine ribosyltransferase-isomerase QueA [Oscillospiraceae bacterium]|nr:tRNA preQ1(34) S-adenosylmethionine ribosyltransferase-isomerase QueA [Oscillospiraceae bacterium]